MIETTILIVVFACVAGFIIYKNVSKVPKEEGTGIKSIKRWRHGWAPITLVLGDSFLAHEAATLTKALRDAIDFWNEQVGVKLFILLEDEVAIDGHLVPVIDAEVVAESAHPSAAAFTHLRFYDDSSIESAAIYLCDWENLNDWRLRRTIRHEIGHALGLEDDDDENSVMDWKISDAPYGVSEVDKGFLLEVYG